MLNFFEKKYYDVDNIVLYNCVNFQNQLCCILGSEKITNLDFSIGEQ
jgi:hypothetical protein